MNLNSNRVWINKYYHDVIVQALTVGIVRVHRDTILQADDIGVRIDMIEEKIMNGEIELLVSNYKNLMCGPNEDFNVSSGTNLQWLER